jgi:ankyrin repeat protein
MNDKHYPLRQSGFMPAIFLAVTVLLLIGFDGCEKQDEAPAVKAEPPVLNESFPIAEPALSHAVIAGDVARVKEIIGAGADVNMKDALDRTPLHLAAFHGQVEIIDLLIAHGADVNARDLTAMPPLHAAVIAGKRGAAVQMLLDRHADLHAINKEGQTALHLAAATGQPKLTKSLIERGADVHRADSNGQLPVYYARRNHHPQTTAVLERAARGKPAAVPDAGNLPQAGN